MKQIKVYSPLQNPEYVGSYANDNRLANTVTRENWEKRNPATEENG